MSDVYGSMLTTNGSQYLHPDYLQPLPTTLDAKKSPLALLAQTCSSIGKDSNVPPSKQIIPPIEKKEHLDKSSPSKNADENTKQEADKPETENENSEKRERRSPKTSREHCKSPVERGTTEKIRRNSRESRSPRHSPVSSPNHREVAEKQSQNLDSNQTEHANKPSKSPVSSASSSSSSNVSSSKPGSVGHPLQPSISFGSSLPPGYPLISAHGLPMDPTLASAYSSLGAHMNSLNPYAASALKSSMSPYVSYSRIRTSNGSTLIPVCRDPYCTNCQLSLQNSHLSATCTASGCSQCAHEKSLLASMYSPQSLIPHSLPHSLSGLGVYGGMPGSASYANSALLSASMYPYGLLSSPPAHGIPPFVCNWVAGSDYCGKRFSTSEELLHHLRTHTSGSDSVASLAAQYQLGLIPPSASALAALHAHYMSPGSLSPNSAARRPYPLSLSPVNSSITSSRFHPYKSTIPQMPPSPSLAATHPTLAPYYSPYSLYAQRIGAAAP